MSNAVPAHREKRRFATNLVSMLTSDVLNRGTTFLIYILVARQLGTYAFGQMSLALTLLFSFQVIAAFGMQRLITREVAKDLSRSSQFFVNALLVGLFTSIGATALLAITVLLLQYSPETRDLILLTSVGLVPFTVAAICDSIIRGFEKMHLIAFAQIPVNVAKIVATIVVLLLGGTVFEVVAILVLAQLAIACVLLLLVLTRLRIWQPQSLDPRFAWSIAKQAATFMGIETVVAWWVSVNIILLSKLTSETEVGLYNAAAQLLMPLAIFIQGVMTSSYPILCRRFAAGSERVHQVSNRLLELVFMLVIPGAIGMFLIAEIALPVVYGQQEFAAAAGVLRITVFIVILTSLTSILGQLLMASGREKTTLRIVIVDLIVGFVLGWIMISNFGLIGAAWAALLTRFVDFLQHLGPVYELVSQIEITRQLWKPLLASAVMGGYLLLIDDWNLVVMIATAAALYFATYFVIESLTVGGFRKLRTRYL